MPIGYIYQILNTVTNKSYIGQTKRLPHQRFNGHIKAAKAATEPSGIQAALRKYDIEVFEFYILAEAPQEELNDLEMYYIQKYDTYHNGYNQTLGGEGSSTVDLNDAEVIAKYQEIGNIKKVAKFFGTYDAPISNILHRNNITLNHKTPDVKKKIRIIELSKDFDSIKACAEWLIAKGYSNAATTHAAQSGISRVLNGVRKSYVGFTFETLV